MTETAHQVSADAADSIAELSHQYTSMLGQTADSIYNSMDLFSKPAERMQKASSLCMAYEAELGESKKYIAGNAAVQWMGMLSNAVMIFSKLLQLGGGYREKVSTSEVVQVSVEGVDQLETYFGQYLPQFFYAMLAPVTLFVMLSFVSLKSAIVLLICVPLIPAAIVAVQKIAKKLLNKYWGQYTKLGDTFLENLQGLTTLKIYQIDEYKN